MKNTSREDITVMLHTFGGNDGGTSFVNFNAFMENLNPEIPSDAEILKIIHEASAVIGYFQK